MARIAAPNPRIIEMVKQGLTTDAICAELGLRPRGLEHHLTLARKMGLLPPSKFDPRRVDREAPALRTAHQHGSPSGDQYKAPHAR